MKRFLATAVILLFIGMSISSSVGFNLEKQSVIPTSQGSKTLYVDDDFNETTPGWNVTHFATIKAAIDLAENGTTIYVYNGTYYGSHNIPKTLTLIGEDKNSTIIDAEKRAHAMNFNAYYINLSGFTICNTRDWANDCGIYLHNQWTDPIKTHYNTIKNNIFYAHREAAITTIGSNYNIIADNVFMDCNSGIESGAIHKENIIANNTVIGCDIFLWGDPKNDVVIDNHIISGSIIVKAGLNNLIKNNEVENGGNIELLWETTGNTIEDNTLTSSGAIVLEETTNNILRNNNFINSKGISIFGSDIDFWKTHSIENNNADGKPIYFYKNQNGITIPTDASQVILVNCERCIVKYLYISNLKDGIQLGFSSENTISSNEIYDNTDTGIKLQDSQRNLINNNTIKNNSKYGIELLGYAHRNEIYDNNIVSNNNGILDRGKSDSNNIYNNKIEDNTNYGIYLMGESNKVNRNSIKNNKRGIYLDFSYFNVISNNNFINNTQYHAFYKVEYFNPKSNFWFKNYYDNINFLFKTIFGAVKTKFYYWDMWFENKIYIYRPGYQIDWFPARKPYDIEV